VGLKAPDSVPGNLIWTLPTTFGAAGSVLTHLDGAGTLAWQSFPSTLTLTDLTVTGRLAVGSGGFFGPGGSINISGDFNANGNVGGNQYFAGGTPGFTSVGAKVAGACSFFIKGGIITNVTGC
jgi:hypothetical protein